MKKALLISVILALPLLSLNAEENAVKIEQVPERDSLLIADQLNLKYSLKDFPLDSRIELPAFKDTLVRDLMIVRPWKIDTLKVRKRKNVAELDAVMTVTSFEEGEFRIPDISIVRHDADSNTDTLRFKGKVVTFCTIPVDTLTFQINDIKPQKTYPVTFREVAPWVGGAVLLIGLVCLIIYLLRRKKAMEEDLLPKDPPHIIALRKLDKYRADKYWEPANQKAFYSGVTDALREYIEARYGISAVQMTTAEIFASMPKDDIPDELRDALKELFERSDFVKFAKCVASDKENAEVLPLAVRFVTDTYREDIKEEGEKNVL